jgi:hypothetical protein
MAEEYFLSLYIVSQSIEMSRNGAWEEKTSDIRICQPSDDEKFYFSVERWQVKELSSEHT